MAWTAPHTYIEDATLLSTEMQIITDDINYLIGRPADIYRLDEGADLTTTLTTWALVSALMNLSVTTTGSSVLVGFNGIAENSGGSSIFFDIYVDDVAEGGDDGLWAVHADSANDAQNASHSYLVTGLSAATHTFKLYWKLAAANTGTLYAGAGTSDGDIHSGFWAKEI